MPPKKSSTVVTPSKRKATQTPSKQVSAGKKPKLTPASKSNAAITASGMKTKSPLAKEPMTHNSDESDVDITMIRKRPLKQLQTADPPIKFEEGVASKTDVLPTTCRKFKLDFSAADATIITFVDGENKKLGILHKVAVVRYCEDLRTLLENPESEEARTATIKLSNTTLDTFQVFNNWVYYAFDEIAAPVLYDVEYAKLWIFAINYKVFELEIDIIQNLVHRFALEEQAPPSPGDKATQMKTDFGQFAHLAYTHGPETSLAKLAHDRLIKLALSGQDVKVWWNCFPGALKSALIRSLFDIVKLNAFKLKKGIVSVEGCLEFGLLAKERRRLEEEQRQDAREKIASDEGGKGNQEVDVHERIEG